MVSTSEGEECSDFQLFVIYMLALESTVESVFMSSQIFPRIISQIGGISKWGRTLLLDSLYNLIRNCSNPQKYFSVRDVFRLVQNLKLEDYSSQFKIIDILNAFLEIEEFKDFENILFLCVEHVGKCLFFGFERCDMGKNLCISVQGVWNCL